MTFAGSSNPRSNSPLPAIRSLVVEPPADSHATLPISDIDACPPRLGTRLNRGIRFACCSKGQTNDSPFGQTPLLSKSAKVADVGTSPTSRYSGSYLIKRDGGEEYSYEGAVFETAYGTNWYAKVFHCGQLAGIPNGTIMGVAPDEAPASIRRQIEWTIEVMDGIA